MNEESTPYESAIFQKKDREDYYERLALRADRTITIVLTLFLFFGFVLAAKHNTWLVALLVGGLSFVSFLLVRLIFPDKDWHRYLGSAVMGIFCMQFIHQMHGAYVMHFGPFVCATTLIMYQNWKIQVPLVAIALGGYIAAAIMITSGATGVYFYVDLLDNGPQTFLLHFFGSILIFGVCVFWSFILAKRSNRLRKQLLMNRDRVRFLEKNIEFAQKLADHELDFEYKLEDDDELGKTLLTLRDNLKEVNAKEAIEKFHNMGLAEISQILRNFDGDFKEVSNRLVSYLVNYFGANQGGLYLVGNDKEGQECLELVSFYAWERIKYTNQFIYKGEGLVGQAYQEEETVYLTQVPENYIHVTSGLGYANPDAVLIVPLKINGQVYGVIELAAFDKFEPYKIAFLEKLGESIASSVANQRNAAYTKKLLEESQQLTEQLQSRDEEMRQNMEELQATQEEILRKEKQQNEQVEKMKEHYNKQIEEMVEQLKSKEELEAERAKLKKKNGEA